VSFAGNGIGLWIVDWVIDNSGATVDDETGAGGTDVTIRIPS